MITLLIFLFGTMLAGFHPGTNYTITSGKYDELKIAYNPENKLVTGYYFNGTGDDRHGHSQFTCIFYLEGKLAGNKAKLVTYYPSDKKEIEVGTLTVTGDNEFTIKLAKDHGGCWNVQPFEKEPVDFQLDQKEKWLEAKYVITPRAYFYNDKNDATKRKAYMVKGDVIYIDKIENGWLHCTYYNESDKSTTGWIKSGVINIDPDN